MDIKDYLNPNRVINHSSSLKIHHNSMNVHTLLFMNTTGKTVHSISNIKLTTITTKDSKAWIYYTK